MTSPSLLEHKPLDFDGTWAILESSIEQITTQFSRGLPNERWMQLYTYVYKMCASPTKPLHQKMYWALKSFLERHVARISLALQSAHGEVLSEYWQSWHAYDRGMKYVHEIFQYLNRYWIKRHCEDGDSPIHGVFPVYVLAVNVWREHMFVHAEERVYAAMIEQIDAERDGGLIDWSIIQKVLCSLSELAPKQTNVLIVYKHSFEQRFLAETEEYYVCKSDKLMSSRSCAEYMRLAEALIANEINHASRYLHHSTLEQLMRRCERALIERQKDKLHAEFGALLAANDYEDLQRMHQLLCRLSDGCRPLHSMLRQHIETSGIEAIKCSLEPTGNATEPKGLEARQYVETLLQIFHHFSHLVETAFSQEAGFVLALEHACRRFMNINRRSPELVARFCHTLLERGSKSAEELPAEQMLVELNTVVRFLEDKDIFQLFYAKLLAKRLIHDTSASVDLEELMIGLLKETCGYDFTSKLQRMFTDKQLCQQLQESFKQHLARNKISCGVDFGILVLTTGSWPLHSQPIAFDVPAELEASVAEFTHFYQTSHHGRRLNWLHYLARADVRTTYLKRRYEFQVATFQLAVLLLFNTADTISLADIQSFVQLKDADLKRTLVSLLKPQILKIIQPVESANVSELEAQMTADCMFGLNMDFYNKRTRIKVTAQLQAETTQETESTHKHIREDRRILIQAAIVRIMKSRKEMDHNNLMYEVLSQLKSRFQPSVADVKKNIDVLIEKEYLERGDEAQRNIYRYIA